LSEVNVARYRLRFLLQEFDLPRGATLIGRSSDCHVTIEDPLVSRQHARIVIDGDDATLQDLGSRNGVKVNGAAIRNPTKLKDGDRLRVGTQELVFCRVEQAANASAKTTGFLRHCAKCRLPYPQEVVACPNCGATEQLDEETLSGQFGASQGSWSVQLLTEVLEKALSLSRVADAERILRRATAQVEERIVQREEVDPRQLATLADAAARVSLESGDPTWGCWSAQVYRRVPHVPDGELIEHLAELVARHPVEIGEAVDGLAAHYAAQSRSLSAEETAAIARLEQLRASLKDLRSAPRGANPHLS
jgi:hypothetical protein